MYATDEWGESSGVQHINYAAFQGCPIKTVFLPHTLDENGISDNNFTGAKVIAKKDTTGYDYAKDKNLELSTALTNYSKLSAANITLGSSVKINGMAVGGEGEYSYHVLYKKASSKSWLKLSDAYEKKSTFSFKPGSATVYDIKVKIKDEDGNIKSKTFQLNVVAPPKNETTISATTVKAGTKVVLKGAASGGSGKGYTYAFYYKKKSSKKWTEMQPPFTTKSASFKPGSATTYNIMVVAKDSLGGKDKKSFNVTVTK